MAVAPMLDRVTDWRNFLDIDLTDQQNQNFVCMEEQAAHLATKSFWKILNGLQDERCALRNPEGRKLKNRKTVPGISLQSRSQARDEGALTRNCHPASDKDA